MHEEYPSDPPLQSPELLDILAKTGNHFHGVSWNDSSDVENEASGSEAVNDEAVDEPSLMDKQEVEAESETDHVLRAEARAATKAQTAKATGLKIRRPGKSSRVPGNGTNEAPGKRTRKIDVTSASDSDSSARNSDAQARQSKKKKRRQHHIEHEEQSESDVVSSDNELPIVVTVPVLSSFMPAVVRSLFACTLVVHIPDGSH